MTPRPLLTLASAALCLALSAAWAADDPAFTPIFNGKDLNGWEGDPALWSVKDGAITGVTTTTSPLKYNKFLIWRGGAPKNFELKARLKVVGNNNSGIQYRSKQLKDAGEFVVAGYQMDVHPSPNYNAMLYDERGRGILAESGQKVVIDGKGKKHVGTLGKPSPFKLDEWNDYEIIARGNHLVHKLNGKTTVDVVDHQESQRELEGIIALQVHAGPAMTVQFQSIELKTLPDGGLLSPNDAPVTDDLKAAATPKPRAKAAQKKAQAPAPPATPVARLKTAKGFKVELVHTVERESEGSWVSMAVDPKGRLIVSDQYGKLYRVTPSKVGGEASETKVEPIDVEIGEAQGLLWAFDSLYVVVNRGSKYDSGLYRVRDTDGDDNLDKVELLRKLEGGGEHGPHAVVLSPDGKSLRVVAGNATKLPEVTGSLVPRDWGEDSLIPRMPDGAGFMTTEKAPGGWVCKVDPDGKNWEIVSTGFRNPYDLAFDKDGELFTYDSDMEWDVSLPWYRPTRVCHVTSGSEFGYRNGSGKWPTYYFDSLPPVVDIGPGSPTGIAFGYGTKFPEKYRDALFICDWSYGKLYALFMKPDGSSYKADVEEFVSGSPLPLTDLVVNPKDGSLYFAIGGRRTTSSLYRVVLDQPQSLSPPEDTPGHEARELRHKLEAFHGHADPKAVETVWPYLGHPDRFTAFAARVALEFQDPASWRERALAETDPSKALPALLALIRVSAKDPAHRSSDDTPVDDALASSTLRALDKLAARPPNGTHRLDLLRDYEVLMTRFGKPAGPAAEQILSRLRPWFPSASREENTELAQIFVALEAPDAASKVVALLAKAPTQEEQIDYAKDLRQLKSGWTPELRMAYFAWFLKAAEYKGGNSFGGFMKQIKAASVANLSSQEKADLQPIIDASVLGQSRSRTATAAAPPRPVVKTWTMDELLPLVEKNLHGRDYDRGRSLFAAASCFSCHRFNNEGGGAGPELTGLAGRFNPHDLLESIVLPSKVISDQYAAVMISTTDGRVVTGRVVNLNGDTMSINTNMLDPNLQVQVNRLRIDEMKPSPVSMMPEGLLNTLNRDEVLDLMAYLLSRGDRNAEPYRKP